MTDQSNASGLERDEGMDPSDVLKQAERLSKASSDTVLKYILVVGMALGAVVFFLQYRQSSSAPDRLFSLLENNARDQKESLQNTTASLKVQEAALSKIQEFSIRVPMEHASADRKLDDNAASIGQMRTEQAELRSAVKANTEAVQANTKAVAELIDAMKVKLDVLTPKNYPTPPN